MITWRGLAFILLILLVYLTLSYSGLYILVILLLALLILPVLSGLQLMISRRKISIEQILDSSLVVREGQNRLCVQLKRNGLWSFGMMDITVRLPGPRGQEVFVRKQIVLLAKTANTAEFSINCTHRGVFQVGLWRVRVRDLFGLFFLPVRSPRQSQKQMLTLTVLPVPRQITDTAQIAAIMGIKHDQLPRPGDEIDNIANLRTQQPGDSLKRTHWKLSARLNEIMIKEFENPISRECLLILDLARPEYIKNNPESCLDLADFFTDRAAYLIQMILQAGNPVKMVSYQARGRSVFSAESFLDFSPVQLMLAEIDWGDEFPAEGVLAEETPIHRPVWSVILFSTRLNSKTAQYLMELQERGLQVLLILITGLQITAPDLDEAQDTLIRGHLPFILIPWPEEQKDNP